MICSKCGGRIGTSDPSCPHCGAPLEEAAKEGKSGGRKGFELLFAFTAALVLIGLIAGCSYFLPIYFKGLPTIDAAFYSKEANDLYMVSDLQSVPVLVTDSLSKTSPGVVQSDNGRFFAFVEEQSGMDVLCYTVVDEKGGLEKHVIDTGAVDVTMTAKGDKVYYRKDGYLYRYENNMSTKLYQRPVNWYKLSGTQSVVLFACQPAEGEGEDLFLLDFAQSDVRVTAVDTNAVQLDDSLQTKRFAKLAYAKVQENGLYTVYFYENGEAKVLTRDAAQFSVGSDGSVLVLRPCGSSLTYSRFVVDDMAEADRASEAAPTDEEEDMTAEESSPGEDAGDATRRNEIRQLLRTPCDLPLYDAYYVTSQSEDLVAEGVFGMDRCDMESGAFILNISQALAARTVPLSALETEDPIAALKEAVLAGGSRKVLYTGAAETAVLAEPETGKTVTVIPADNWKKFYRYTAGTGGQGVLEVCSDPSKGEFTVIDSNVTDVPEGTSYRDLLYVRGTGDLYAYDGSFSSILAADADASTLTAHEEGSVLIYIEDSDSRSLVLLRDGKKNLLAPTASAYSYKQSTCIYYTVPTIGDRSDLYRSTGSGDSKLVDRDISAVY